MLPRRHSKHENPNVQEDIKGCLNCVKGSVERSSLPWAIFVIFTRRRSWKSEDYLCTLFFIEMSKKRLEKSEITPPVSWRPWALAYSPDRPYNFSCLSAVQKKRRFGSFFSAWGWHLSRKSLSWIATPVSYKNMASNAMSRIENQDRTCLVQILLSQTFLPWSFCTEKHKITLLAFCSQKQTECESHFKWFCTSLVKSLTLTLISPSSVLSSSPRGF